MQNVVVELFHPEQHRRLRHLEESLDYAALIGLSLLMINWQQLNLAQLNSQSLKPVRVDLRELDQNSALPRDDDHFKDLRPLKVARQRESLD